MRYDYGQIPTVEDLIEDRRQTWTARIVSSEIERGIKLSRWQFEAALSFLIYNEFMSAGRGAGKTFLAEFLQPLVLIEEPEA